MKAQYYKKVWITSSNPKSNAGHFEADCLRLLVMGFKKNTSATELEGKK